MTDVPTSLPPSTEVVVVGAGLAGLRATQLLLEAGVETYLLEASDGIGGRVRTDRVDGLQLDRGFQLYNPAYPEAAKVFDHAALDLRPLVAGVEVASGRRRYPLLDPRREPAAALGALPAVLAAPLGRHTDQARFAAYAWQAARASMDELAQRADVDTATALQTAGIEDGLVDTVLRPFLAGVFAEDELSTSRRFLDLVLRSFVRGTPSVPASGMGALSEQLAAGILRAHPNTAHVLIEHPVERIDGTTVRVAGTTVRARAVLVATDAPAATRLLPGLDVPEMRALTTWYHLADGPPHLLTGGRSVLVVDGQRRGPVVNTVVLTHAAPSYATQGRVLVASTTLGVTSQEGSPPAAEADVRGHLGLLYGTDTRGWEAVGYYPIAAALPAFPARPGGTTLRQPVRLDDGVYVCGDHRDTPSIQGALVSGRRAAEAVLADLGHGGTT